LRSLRGARLLLDAVVLVSVLAAVLDVALELVSVLGVLVAVLGVVVVVVVDVLGVVVVVVSVFVPVSTEVPAVPVLVDCATARPTPAISDAAAAAMVRRLDGVMTWISCCRLKGRSENIARPR
jgi:hypothetical protein